LDKFPSVSGSQELSSHILSSFVSAPVGCCLCWRQLGICFCFSFCLGGRHHGGRPICPVHTPGSIGHCPAGCSDPSPSMPVSAALPPGWLVSADHTLFSLGCRQDLARAHTPFNCLPGRHQPHYPCNSISKREARHAAEATQVDLLPSVQKC
jgi:hypothetical protein